MKLFISYAHVDQEPVLALVEAFQEAGYDPWFDVSILPGRNWQAELANQIEAAAVFIFMLTKAAVQSEWCRWEFATAVARNKPIIPILLEAGATDEPQYPPALRAIQYVDLSAGIQMGPVIRLTRSLESLGRVLDPADVAAVPTPQFSPLDSPGQAGQTYAIRQSVQNSTNVNQVGVVQGNLNLSTHDMRGASFSGITNISSRLDNVPQALNQNPAIPANDRAEIERLVGELKQVLENVQPAHAEDAALVAELTEELVQKASAPDANPRRIQISGDNLMQAARNLAAVTPLVLTIASQIVQKIAGLP